MSVDEGPFTWDEDGRLVPLDTRERVRLHRTGDLRAMEERRTYSLPFPIADPARRKKFHQWLALLGVLVASFIAGCLYWPLHIATAFCAIALWQKAKTWIWYR